MSKKHISLVLIFCFLACGCNEYDAPLSTKTNSNETTSESSIPDEDSDTETSAKTRSFQFVYGAALTELEPGTKVRVWLPVATSNHDQDVEIVATNLPASHQMTKEKKYENDLIYFEAVANEEGEVPMEVTYKITRKEITKVNYETATDDGTTFLAASSLVPTTDELRKEVLGDADPAGRPLAKARKLYDGVEQHMKYDKPSDKAGWGNGDAAWACGNGFGNCTDFHSLFISSARNLEIPARFEIGFPIPTEIGEGKVGGYHCWAKFLADGKWMPVDISEADKHPELKDYYFGNLTADRVMFSLGRDLELQPAPAAETVNYLAYPYAEVDGKQHKRFRKAFRYSDVETIAVK